MNVLVIGSGGREHALAWRLAQSRSVSRVYAAPGNPGMARVAECIAPSSQSPEGLLELARSLGVGLVVAGPEAPLVVGVVDLFRSASIPIVGPTRAAAQLEGSKIFAKNFMERAGVPTARFTSVDTEAAAFRAIEEFGAPVVLKADGLAAGKGVVVAMDRDEARAAAHSILSGELVGAAGTRLVVEEFLRGEEVSFIVLSDGKHIVPLEPTQDHKAVSDGDTGPNTGGMGAYRDSRILEPAQREEVIRKIIRPVIDRMSEEGNPFTGFLYAGLMMTDNGPKVLEFNVRLGDPETQPLMHGLECNLAEVLLAAANGDLSGATLTWRPEPSVCIVLASHGYPAAQRTGDPITGIEDAERLGAAVFHAGTKVAGGTLVTSGGRVLGVTASGLDLATAIENAYRATRSIAFDGMHYRSDIGAKGLKRWAGAPLR